jgi:hypothetical protein
LLRKLSDDLLDVKEKKGKSMLLLVIDEQIGTVVVTAVNGGVPGLPEDLAGVIDKS